MHARSLVGVALDVWEDFERPFKQAVFLEDGSVAFTRGEPFPLPDETIVARIAFGD
jgi:hypothetical protein